jgi:vancomycin resistance protein YoaR
MKMKHSWIPIPVILFCSLLLVASMYVAAQSAALEERLRYFSDSNSVSDATLSAGETDSDTVGREKPDGREADASEETIGEYTASSESDDAQRADTIALAVTVLDGQVIEPGATFSFNSAAGEIKDISSSSYLPFIQDSSQDAGLGDEMSQLATALYIAALYAGLDVSERHAHEYRVDYAPLGLDAMVTVDGPDLKIINTSASPVTIQASCEDQAATVSLVGQPLEDGFTIKVSSRLLGYQDAEGNTKEPPASNADRATEEDIYCVVDSYRQYYRLEDMVYEELLAEDRYLE